MNKWPSSKPCGGHFAVPSTPHFRQPEAGQMASPLFRLADELLLAIIGSMEISQGTLNDFTLTCQKAKLLAEPFLYKDFRVYSMLRDSHANIMDALLASPDHPWRSLRGSYVRNLQIRCKKGDQSRFELFSGSLARLFPRLQSLHLETPCPNDVRAQGEDFQAAGRILYWLDILELKHLESLHLHTHVESSGRRKWFDLGGGQGAKIFLSQSLRHIHLSCADLTPSTVRLLKDNPIRTNLQTLVFQECNINAAALESILSIPKALRRLTLGERLYHFDPTQGGSSLSTDRDASRRALRSQAPSLEYLKHTTTSSPSFLSVLRTSRSGFPSRATDSGSLPIFVNLQELDLCDGVVSEHSYPALRKLTLRDEVFNLDHRYLIFFAQHFLGDPWPKHVELQMEMRVLASGQTLQQGLEDLCSEDSESNPFSSPLTRILCFNSAERLRRAGTRLTIMAVLSHGFIPPYMLGEAEPTEVIIYDSNDLTCFGSKAFGIWFRDKQVEAGSPPSELTQQEPAT